MKPLAVLSVAGQVAERLRSEILAAHFALRACEGRVIATESAAPPTPAIGSAEPV
jgi:hypothetical protein